MLLRIENRRFKAILPETERKAEDMGREARPYILVSAGVIGNWEWKRCGGRVRRAVQQPGVS